MKKQKTVAVSSGFDPLHIGHVRMMKEARALGDRLVVILNNDNWILDKKGFVFMKQDERKEILLSLRFVDEVITTLHKKGDTDRSVSRELQKIRPAIFANGGDRDKTDAKNTSSSLHKDIRTCKEIGTDIIFGVGRGGKVQSSSWLLDIVKTQGKTTKCPRGSIAKRKGKKY